MTQLISNNPTIIQSYEVCATPTRRHMVYSDVPVETSIDVAFTNPTSLTDADGIGQLNVAPFIRLLSPIDELFDYTTWIENDPLGKITVTPTQVTTVGPTTTEYVELNEPGIVDYLAAAIPGSEIDIEFDLQCDSFDDTQEEIFTGMFLQSTAGSTYLTVFTYPYFHIGLWAPLPGAVVKVILEMQASAISPVFITISSTALTLGTTYYIRTWSNLVEDVGLATWAGNITAQIFSDAIYSNLIETLVIPVTDFPTLELSSFRFISCGAADYSLGAITASVANFKVRIANLTGNLICKRF